MTVSLLTPIPELAHVMTPLSTTIQMSTLTDIMKIWVLVLRSLNVLLVNNGISKSIDVNSNKSVMTNMKFGLMNCGNVPQLCQINAIKDSMIFTENASNIVTSSIWNTIGVLQMSVDVNHINTGNGIPKFTFLPQKLLKTKILLKILT